MEGDDIEAKGDTKDDESIRSASQVDECETDRNSGIRKDIKGSGSFSTALNRMISSVQDEEIIHVRREPSARSVMRRSNTFNLSNMSAAEVTNLMDKTIYKKTLSQTLKPYLPIILWVLWLLCGTFFYALYDDFGWAEGLLMSVNVGWSIAWSLPSDPPPARYRSSFSKVISMVHMIVGAIFLGVAVLFMAQDLMENKDSWIAMSSEKDEMENHLLKTKTLWDKLVAFWRYYISKLRVAKWSVVWILFGCFWYKYGHDFEDVFGVMNFITSTLCAGGYISLDANSNALQYTVTAVYAAIGIPLFNVSLGLLLSLILKKTEDKVIYEKMVEPVTKREQEFMEAFGIDDGDGSLDYKEYVILMAVRMGSVPPNLVKEIQDRFHMLDRKHCGEIKYSDLMMPEKPLTRKERIQNFVGSSAKSLSGSFNRSISKSFDMTDPTMFPPPVTQSPTPSGKVLPLQGSDGDGNIVIIPPDISSPTSKVTPFKDTFTDNDMSETKIDSQPPLRCSNSIEALENIELPEENPNESIKGLIDKDFDSDDNSVKSIVSFGEADISPPKGSPPDISSEDEEDSFVVKPMEISKGLVKRLSGTFKTDSPRRRQKKTFRASMSFNSDDEKNKVGQGENKLTLRQKEFLEEQEKLRQAQLHIEKKNNMSSLVYFWKLRLLPNLGAIIIWFAWLLGGATFYTNHEDVSLSKGLYMSTSIGYGIFWIDLKGDFVSNAYTLVHFLIGIGMISAAMALLAQYLLSQDKNWYSAAMKAKQLEVAMETEGLLDDVIALFHYYWPHFKVYCIFFGFWALGTAFAAFAFEQWGFVDCLYFAISIMTSGGFVTIPNDAPDWCYLFVCFYVALGVPIMSSSCGILAHQMANSGSAQLKIEKVNAHVTSEEIEKMKWYGIEDDSGAVDHKEYVILILVRIGAISPEIISVLHDRFDQLDEEKSGEITYERLRGGGNAEGSRNDDQSSTSPV